MVAGPDVRRINPKYRAMSINFGRRFDALGGCRLPNAICRGTDETAVGGCRLPDAGCRMPDTGCRMQEAGCGLPGWRCRMPRGVGRWSLAGGRWPVAVPDADMRQTKTDHHIIRHDSDRIMSYDIYWEVKY